MPRSGFVAWNAQSQQLTVFEGTAWQPVGGAGSADFLGLNAIADETTRLAVASPFSRFSHDGADHRMIIDKASPADVASLIYQSGMSGRAEIGLVGDDSLHLKVSADGTVFRDALVVDSVSGTVEFPLTPRGMVNLLINGSFAVNQREFSGGALAAGVYGHDRFKAGAGGASYSVAAGFVSHASGKLTQIIEAPRLAGQRVTFSVEDLSGGDLLVTIEGQTGTVTAGSGRRKTTLDVPAASTGDVTVSWEPTGAAVSYRNVQLNRGGAAAGFEQIGHAAERSNCLRYFERQRFTVAPGFSPVETAAYGGFGFAPKRAVPAISAIAAMGCVRNTGPLFSSPPITGYTFYDIDASGNGMVVADVGGGLTVGAGCLVQLRGDALDIDAEL